MLSIDMHIDVDREHHDHIDHDHDVMITYVPRGTYVRVHGQRVRCFGSKPRLVVVVVALMALTCARVSTSRRLFYFLHLGA